MFWQLTVNAEDPERLAQFWAAALGYEFAPPREPVTTWNEHYRGRLGGRAAFPDRIFDPGGIRPPLWFQHAPGPKTGPTRLHLDLYPTGRDNTLPQSHRVQLIDTEVARLVELGAVVQRSERDDDPADPVYFVVLRDPEDNEFCVS